MKIQINFEDNNGDATFYTEKENSTEIELEHQMWSQAMALLEDAYKHMKSIFEIELSSSWDEYREESKDE